MRERLLLAAVLVLAGGLRFHDLDRNAYWDDEFQSLVLSNGQVVWANQPRPGSFPADRPRPTRITDALPAALIPSVLVADNHPPLYFMALRVWRTLFGDGEAATRSLSVLFSLLALVALHDAVRSLLGWVPALWAALLLALAAPDIALARETRSYSLLLLWVLVACAALARLETRGANKARALALAVASCGGMLTHYFAAFPLAVLAIYAALRLDAAPRRAALIAFASAAAAYLATWGPFAAYSRWLAVDNADWLAAATEQPAAQTLARLAALPWRLLAGPIWAQTPGAAWPVVLYAVAIAIAWQQPRARLWFALFAGVIGCVAALDLWRETRQLAVIRYVLPALPAFCALIAAPSSAGGRWSRHLLPAAASLLLAARLPSLYPAPEAAWRRWAAAFERAARPGEPLVVTFRDREMPLYYKAANHYAELPRELFVLTRHPSALALSRLPRTGYFWLATEADPEALIPGARIERRLPRPQTPPTYRLTLMRE